VDLNKTKEFKPIHMPKNSAKPFIMSVFFFISGFGFVFEWYGMGFAGLIGVLVCLWLRSQDQHTDYHIPVEEIKHTEASYGRL
jgi:cytochrome aa3-600 menaquinol oxidase subunit 1